MHVDKYLELDVNVRELPTAASALQRVVAEVRRGGGPHS